MSTLSAPPNVPTQAAEEERQQKITAYYEREIQKGLESGPPIPVTPEFWDKLNADIEEERRQKVWDYYEQEILKTLKKSKSVPYTPEFWDKIRADVEQRLQAKQAEKAT